MKYLSEYVYEIYLSFFCIKVLYAVNSVNVYIIDAHITIICYTNLFKFFIIFL